MVKIGLGIVLFFSFSIVYANEKACNTAFSQTVEVHQWGSSKYIANLRPKKNPDSSSRYVFEVLNSETLVNNMFSKDTKNFPALRLELKNKNIQNVRFFKNSEYLLLELTNNKKSLYKLENQKDSYRPVFSAVGLKQSESLTHKSVLYQYNPQSLWISALAKDYFRGPYYNPPATPHKLMESKIDLSNTRALAEVFSGKHQIFGVSHLYFEGIQVLIDYNYKAQSGSVERRIGIYDLNKNEFASLKAEELYKTQRDWFKSQEILKSGHSIEFQRSFLEIPLLMTGSGDAYSKHYLNIPFHEIRTQALIEGHLNMIENAILNRN